MAQQNCTSCGMPRSQWKANGGQGVSKGGHTYCCEGCASGTASSCK